MGNGDNIDRRTVEGFGQEWLRFDQSALSDTELQALFRQYFSEFPWDRLPPHAQGFDLGCGSGRWANQIAPRVGTLHCIDAAAPALEVARRSLAGQVNCVFHLAGVDAIPLPDASMDFGYSLGVLHHVPDTRAGIRACARKLKAGAPFLVYLYYAFDNRPAWFRVLWRASDLGRQVLSRLPFRLRALVCDAAAVTIYWPLARLARLGEGMGCTVDVWPLSAYRHRSLYGMRTDALDRLGTRLEQRFTRAQIQDMLEQAGFVNIRFRVGEPYWCAVGIKAA